MNPVALRSERQVAFFDFIFARSFRQGMRALRLAQWGLPIVTAGVPVVVFANHPSWWDGMAFPLLARRLFPTRPSFVPMDAEALEKYAFMRRLGAFGIAQDTPRGAIRFLKDAGAVLAAPAHMLWINAPGRFSDARERPVPIAAGLARLPELAPTAVFLPLALEHVFWSERRAETLAAFGPPIAATTLLAGNRAARIKIMRAALTATMDHLAQDAISREEDRFTPLLTAAEGMGGLYGRWQWLRALLRGKPYDPRHQTQNQR